MASNDVLVSQRWTDYSRPHGLTITLTQQHGKWLQSFTAAFISTIVGGAVWSIVTYIIFQVRAGRYPRTIVHHQIQVHLRNASSPMMTIWNFFLLLIAWRGTRKLAGYWSSVLACILISLFALAVTLGFLAASVFSSSISTSVGDQVLVSSGACGMWDVSETPADSSFYLSNYQSITQNRTSAGDAYARLCYHSATISPACNSLVARELTWSANRNASCPFKAGTCLLGDTAAFEMTTDAIDSHISLGINAPPNDRITFRRQTTCAPLHTANYTALVPGELSGERIQMFFYGNVSTEGTLLNTYNVSTYAIAAASGYLLNYVNSYAAIPKSNFSSAFSPAPDFVRTDADVNFFFLAPNDISFIGPSDDPFFPAHSDLYSLGPGFTLYRPDVWSSVMGCTDQYSLCNPSTGACTPLSGLPSMQSQLQQLNLNAAQNSTATVLLWALQETGMTSSIAGRGATALRAQDTVYSNRQGPIPNDQWTIEAAGWFDTALAKLQFSILDFAQGPSVADQALMVVTQPPSNATCSVKMRSTAYTNFSVLGIGIIFGIGLFLVVLSWVLETIVGNIQRMTGWGSSRRLCWILDSRLQLLRQLYQELVPGSVEVRKTWAWEKVDGAVPVLIGREEMAAVAGAKGDGDDDVLGKKGPRYYFPGDEATEVNGRDNKDSSGDIGE